MTRPHALPLDGDALDELLSYATPDDEESGEWVALPPVQALQCIEQAGAALALEAERDALMAQVDEAESHAEWRGSILRDLLRQTSNGDVRGECGTADCLHIWCRVIRDARMALDATPAQSLAAVEREVKP